MKLILTRHGQTEENKKQIVQGHLPGKLTALGKEQAKKLAQALKDKKIDAIYSSDLTRASDTTKEIAKFHTDTPLEFTKELRERDLKRYQGKSYSYVEAEVGEPYRGAWVDYPGTESIAELEERARKFLDKILHKHPKDTVLFVAHGALNVAFLRVITGKTLEETEKMGLPPNTSISIFEINEGKKHKVVLLNSTQHLA